MLGRIDQEQSAERPERLAAEVLLALLVDDDDALAGIGKLGRGDEAGKARTHHDHIGIVGHFLLRAPLRRRLKRWQCDKVKGCDWDVWSREAMRAGD